MYQKPKYPKGKRFSVFLMEDLLIIFIFMVFFSVLVFFFPDLVLSGESAVPADPFNTPEHIKPEWYFLASYQFLKLIPSEFGALAIQSILLLAFIFLPFLDPFPNKRISQRPVFLGIVILAIIAYVGLTVWGAFS